jgi:hypothetical protein
MGRRCEREEGNESKAKVGEGVDKKKGKETVVGEKI